MSLVENPVLEKIPALRGSALNGARASGSRNYRPDIDGLRGVAVLSVIGYHCGIPCFGGGFIGVDVFFVISGYLICSIIHRELQQGTFSIARFYERRFKRILPALFGVLIFCFGVTLLILSPWEARRVAESAIATSLSASNVFFYAIKGNYFARNEELKPLLMTWSLAVEEQFYFVFPLLMVLLHKLGKRHLFTCLVIPSAFSLIVSIYAEFHQPAWNFYMPVSRAWEIAAGAMLAVWESKKIEEQNEPSRNSHIRGITGLLMILASILFYKLGMRYPGFEAVPPVFGTALIISSKDGFANRVLAIRPLTAVGLISYSLYLWHWPLLSFARILSPAPLVPILRVTLMMLAFSIAVLSFHFIEKPFRFRISSAPGKVLRAYGLVIACFVLFGGLLYQSGGLPQRVPTLAGIERVAGLDRHHPCQVGSEVPNLSRECAPAVSSVSAIALLGDSHADALTPGLQAFAVANGLQAVVLTKGSCPPLRGVTRWLAAVSTHADSCSRFNQRALEYVKRRPDIRFVLLAGSWSAPEGKFIADGYQGDSARLSVLESARNLREGLQAEIASLEAAGKQVVLMDDVPILPFDPMRTVRYNQLPVRRLLTRLILGHPLREGENGTVDRASVSTPAAELASRDISSLKLSDANLIIIDPKVVFCSQTACKFADGEKLYYVDEEHVGRLGAVQILSLLHL